MKVREIADAIGGELHGNGEIEISSASDLSKAGSGQIAFADGRGVPEETNASCLIVSKAFFEENPEYSTVVAIAVDNPKLAFARAAALLYPPERPFAEIHPSAVISDTADIGTDVFIGAFASIGDRASIDEGTQLLPGSRIGSDSTIGKHCVVHPNVVIENGCTIGDNVVLHAGVVIGADGFGYVKDEAGEYIKFPQIGTVVIENNVEIGANSCVDRAALGETRIGEGTKIDNLVQVGHNVQIGKHCVIAAQTGISGSVVIEDNCVIGGQVGFGDHVRVMGGAVIGSQAGVLPGKIVRPGIWWGTPIQPLDEYKKQNARVKGLDRLKAEVKELRDRIVSIEADEVENQNKAQSNGPPN